MTNFQKFVLGAVGEMFILDAMYSGDYAWTIATSSYVGGATFDESTCADFQSTAANGDRLFITAVATDSDTAAILSCQYHDQ